MSTGVRPSAYVFIKSVADAGFAAMPMERGEIVGILLHQACTNYTHWQRNSLQMQLFLVKESGDVAPTSAAIHSALVREPLTVSAAVSSGSWVVAVPTPSGGGGHGVCVGAFSSDS